MELKPVFRLCSYQQHSILLIVPYGIETYILNVFETKAGTF